MNIKAIKPFIIHPSSETPFDAFMFFPVFKLQKKIVDIQEIFYSHVITFILLVKLLVCLKDQMNQQKIQNEQSFNTRGHRKMWMFLLLTCAYLIQISSFPNQMTPKKVNQDLMKYK